MSCITGSKNGNGRRAVYDVSRDTRGYNCDRRYRNRSDNQNEAAARSDHFKNQVDPERVVQILISATQDIHSVFPAKALRQFEGWTYVPVTCMQELDIDGGLKKCIRVLMTVQTDVKQEDIQHVYLEEAVTLRPDLQLTKTRNYNTI